MNSENKNTEVVKLRQELYDLQQEASKAVKNGAIAIVLGLISIIIGIVLIAWGKGIDSIYFFIFGAIVLIKGIYHIVQANIGKQMINELTAEIEKESENS